MNREVRFGVVGCGVIAPWHTQSILSIPETKLVAVCDIAPEKADQLAAITKAKPYYNHHDLLADPEIDAICICVPSGLHAAIGIDACRAGKHVLSEKPIDISLDRIDALIDAAESAGVNLGCIFQRRTQKLWQTIRQTVQSGKLGKLILADAYLKYYRSQQYYDSAGWRGTWKLDGGGALMNQGVHCIDLMRWICGDPVSVFARCGHLSRNIEVEDTAVAVVTYSSGAVGVIEGTTSVYKGMDHRLEFHGDSGNILIEGARIVRWETIDEQSPPTDLYAQDGQAAANPVDISVDNHAAQIQDFAQSILEHRAPIVTGAQARGAVEFVLGIYRSSQTNSIVEFPLV